MMEYRSDGVMTFAQSSSAPILQQPISGAMLRYSKNSVLPKSLQFVCQSQRFDIAGGNSAQRSIDFSRALPPLFCPHGAKAS
jgi:hypothetical protein